MELDLVGKLMSAPNVIGWTSLPEAGGSKMASLIICLALQLGWPLSPHKISPAGFLYMVADFLEGENESCEDPWGLCLEVPCCSFCCILPIKANLMASPDQEEGKQTPHPGAASALRCRRKSWGPSLQRLSILQNQISSIIYNTPFSVQWRASVSTYSLSTFSYHLRYCKIY